MRHNSRYGGGGGGWWVGSHGIWVRLRHLFMVIRIRDCCWFDWRVTGWNNLPARKIPVETSFWLPRDKSPELQGRLRTRRSTMNFSKSAHFPNHFRFLSLYFYLFLSFYWPFLFFWMFAFPPGFFLLSTSEFILIGLISFQPVFGFCLKSQRHFLVAFKSTFWPISLHSRFLIRLNELE